MASILQIGTGWRALIRRKDIRPICKTHPTKAAALAWARKIEADLDAGVPVAVDVERHTVGTLIDAYRKLRDSSNPISDTSNEHYMLKMLDRLLGKKDARFLDTKDLRVFAETRKAEGAGPYTLNMDLSKLSTALRYAASDKGLRLPDSVGAARPLLKHLKLIGGGGKRQRRPTTDELDRIVEYLAIERGVVYAEAALFSVATALRLGELCRVLWADVDEKKRLLLVRDRKDPRNKIGNDQWVPLLPAARDLLQRRARDDERIFPITQGTASKYFTEACRKLSIPDLHFHDLRHEGTSQLFEQGYEIPQVALVTGHKKWENLKRYTQLKPEGLHRD